MTPAAHFEILNKMSSQDDVAEYISSRVNRCDLLDIEAMAFHAGNFMVKMELNHTRNT